MRTIEREAIRPFDQIPEFQLPDDFAVRFPQFMAEMAMRHGPIVRRRMPAYMGYLGDWLVYMIGPDANRFVLQTHREHFSHEQGWTPALTPIIEKGLLNTDDPEHAWQRKMMNPAFAMAYMERYIPLMRRIIGERTRGWADQETVDLYAESRRITFDVAAEALVGFRSGPEVDRMRQLFLYLLHGDVTTPADLNEETIRTVMSIREELDGMILRLIARRRENPTDDILGMLVSATDEQGRSFTDHELLGQVHILLVAGHETTTTLNAWLLYLLAAHPDYLARVHAEIDEVLAAHGGELTLRGLRSMKVLGNAMDEAGRLYSPVASLPRGVVKEFDFNGYHVPAGVALRLSVAGGHHLQDVFPDPDRFDPDRFAPPREEGKRTPYALSTFGNGPRVCIGMSFAQIEMKIAAVHILRRFTLEPIPDRPARQLYFGLTASVPNGVHVRVHPCVP